MFLPLTDPAALYCLTSSQVSSGSQQRNDTIMTSFSISASIPPSLFPVCSSPLFPSLNASFSTLLVSNIPWLVWMNSLLPSRLSSCPFLFLISSHYLPSGCVRPSDEHCVVFLVFVGYGSRLSWLLLDCVNQGWIQSLTKHEIKP